MAIQMVVTRRGHRFNRRAIRFLVAAAILLGLGALSRA